MPRKTKREKLILDAEIRRRLLEGQQIKEIIFALGCCFKTVSVRANELSMTRELITSAERKQIIAQRLKEI